MPDPRISKLAKVLVHYSVEVQKGQQVLIRTSPIADELTLAVYEEIIKAGAHPFITNEVPGTKEAFYKFASDEQLDYVSPIEKLIVETFDAYIHLWADYNTRDLSGTDPNRVARSRKAQCGHQPEISKSCCRRKNALVTHGISKLCYGTGSRYVSSGLYRIRLWRGHAQRRGSRCILARRGCQTTTVDQMDEGSRQSGS